MEELGLQWGENHCGADDGGDKVKANISVERMGLSGQVGKVVGGIRALCVDQGEPQNLVVQGLFGQTWAVLQSWGEKQRNSQSLHFGAISW